MGMAAVRNHETAAYLSRARLIEILGAEGAARAVEAFGGTRITIPAPDSPRFSAFAERLGLPAARALAIQFGGERVVLPRRIASLADEIIKLRGEGLSHRAIASTLCCTDRTVRAALARYRDAGPEKFRL